MSALTWRLAGAVAALAAALAYGHWCDQRGYARSENENLVRAAMVGVEYRRLEQRLHDQMEIVRASNYLDRQVTAAAAAGLRRDAAGLRTTLAAERARATEHARGAGGDLARAQAPWVVLAECIGEYEALALDLDGLEDDFRVVQGWAKVTKPAAAIR